MPNTQKVCSPIDEYLNEIARLKQELCGERKKSKQLQSDLEEILKEKIFNLGERDQKYEIENNFANKETSHLAKHHLHLKHRKLMSL